jgi:hypothetical protein
MTDEVDHMKCYLDVSPMIRALSESPSELKMEGNFVRHKSSRHVLKFDVQGNAQLVARCNCSQLPISQQQNVELRTAVAVWINLYWRQLMARQAAERRVAEINRAFAEHFRPRSILRRMLDAVLSFLGIGQPGSPDRVNPALPEDTECLAPPAPEIQKPERKELLSV